MGIAGAAALAAAPLATGCGGGGDNTGRECQSADECFPEVEGDLNGGEAICLDRTPEGYCTHGCTQDADCCALDGECRTDIRQVCAPFESTGMMMCFLSCEAADLEDAGYQDADSYCNDLAARNFTCRSTGGGGLNRRVCFPPG